MVAAEAGLAAGVDIIIADEDGLPLDWTRGVRGDQATEAAARAATLARLARDEAGPLVGEVLEVTVKGSGGTLRVVWDPPLVRVSIEK